MTVWRRRPGDSNLLNNDDGTTNKRVRYLANYGQEFSTTGSEKSSPSKAYSGGSVPSS